MTLLKRLFLTLIVAGTVPAAAAQGITIGSTTFPLGEHAFASQATCLNTSEGCSEISFLGPPPWFPFLPLSGGLTAAYILDVVPTDLDDADIFLLEFDTPLRNEAGPDLYLAQARYFSELALFDTLGVNDFDVRVAGTSPWLTVTADRFAHDPLVGTPTVWYSAPEIKSDAYALWFELVDLDELGVAAGAPVTAIEIRGPVVPDWPDTKGLDVVTVAHLHGLAAGWTDLGNALAGTHGAPALAADGTLAGGDPFALTLSDTPASTTAFLIWGFARIDAPLKGGVLVPDPTPPGVLAAVPTDGSGGIVLNGTWPAGIPSGLTSYLQYWIPDAAGPAGFAASNAVAGTTP